jgi:hypothetical protein
MSMRRVFGSIALGRAAVFCKLVLFGALGAAVGAKSEPALAASPAESFGKYSAGSAKSVDHGAWDKLLGTYVVPGADGVNRVAYGAFKTEGHKALKAYVAALEKTDVSALDRPEQFAFWANLYNAKTIDVVLDAYPVKSIKDINLGGGLLTLVTGGPWKAKVVRVGGQDLSLDDIEHGILRPVFKDPRVHYAVNCASFGCPNIGTEAFTGSRLEAQLDAGARAYVNHPRGITVESGKVKASSIYSWFEADFGGSAKGVLAHLKKYAAPELGAKLGSASGITSYDYDWSLNEATK